MAITWKIDDVTQGQWDLWLNTGKRNDFSGAGATEVDIATFKAEDYTLGDTYDFVVDSQFWGSEVYSWTTEWTTYILDDGTQDHALTFQNVSWDNKAPVYLYIRKNGGASEDDYAAYQVFVDTLQPVFKDDQITVEPALHRNEETHKVVEYWFNKADVVEVGGEGATGATLTITFDDTEAGKFLSSGISALKYSTGKDNDPENPGTDIDWTAFDDEHKIAVDPENITYDEATGKWTLTAFLPDSVDKNGNNIADGNYYQFKLVDGVGNESAAVKIFKAPVDDTAAELDYQPTMIWQDATAPVIEEANMALGGTHVGNDVAQPINGKGPEELGFSVITDRNKPGTPYQFTVNGIAPTQAADKGTELSVVVTYTGVYQELILEDGNYILGEAVTFDGDVATDYDGSVAGWTSNAISLYPEHVGAQAIGYYDVVAKVVDAAGNETSYDHFYVYFDNTLPASPDVVLNDESAIYDEDAKSSYIKEFGAETTVTVTPGSYGTLADGLHAIDLRKEGILPESPIYYEFAAAKGALDIPALVTGRAHFEPENWGETPGVINLDNFTNFWGVASVEDGVVKEDAYSVIFFTQNVYEIESSTFVDQVSVVRFVVDNIAPNAVDYAPSVAKKFPADPTPEDIVWYDDAALTLTFHTKDLWTQDDPKYYEHVSGVASFTINDEVITKGISFNEGLKRWELEYDVIDDASGELGGIWNFEVSATDGAGNAGDAVTKKIGIDTVAPEIEGTSIKWGEEGHVDFEKGVTTLYVGKDVYDEIETEGEFQLVFNAVDYNGATLLGMDKTGSGIDTTVAKSYYTFDGGAHTAFTEAGKGTAAVALDEDVYSYQVFYTDNVGNDFDAPVDYTVCIDATAPVALNFALDGAGEIEVDDIHWFSATGAAVSLTFSAKDKWGDAENIGSLDHVSGVDFFTVGSTKYNAAVNTDDVDHVFFYNTIANIRTGDAGIVEYDFTATDKAGNVSVKYSEQGGGDVFTIGIDDAAPVINNVYVTWGDGEDQKRLIDAETKTVTFTAKDLADFAEQTITKFWLTIDVADVSGATSGDKHGVGLTDNVAKTYYQIDGGANTAFFEAGTKTALNDIVEDTTYVYGLKYTDLFDHGVADDPVEYTVKFDGGPEFSVGGTYAVNGPATGLHNGPTVSDEAATFAGLDKDYASAFDLTFTIGSLAGIQSWTMTKETAEGAVTIFSYDAEKGAVPPVFGLDTTDDEQVADWQLEEGENKYTVTIQDKAGNEPKVQEITLKYDTQVTGTIEVEDQYHKKITKDEDGKYYVTTNNYNLIYGVVDTEENPELSGADRVYYREVTMPESDWENHLILDWDQPVYEKPEGTTTTHQAIVTDKAGNTDDGIEAIVVIDQTAPTISVTADVDTTARKAVVDGTKNLTIANTTIADTIAAGLIDGSLTVNWTTLIDGDLLQITVADTNLAKVFLGEVELDHAIIKLATEAYVGDSDATIVEGTNTWTIKGIDKAGFETTATLTIKFDETAPEIVTVKLDGYDATAKGGDTRATALENKVFAADALNFALDMKATDNISENVEVYYTFVSEDVAVDEATFDDAGNWSVWAKVDGNIESAKKGFYRFAVVDEAGNFAQTKYYYVDQAVLPTKPVISYIDEEGTPFTDVDDKPWFTKGIQVIADFQSGHGYDQWNFIAYKFDDDEYTKAYQAAVEAGDDKPGAAALLAAVHTTKEQMEAGEWNEDFVTHVEKTVSDAKWTWEGPEYEMLPTEYWMFSISESGDVTVGEYKYQFVKVDTTAPVIILDAGDYVEATWTNQDVTINMEVESAGTPVVSQTPLVLPVVVTEEGKSTPEFTATNEAGTTTKEYFEVWIDKTAPVTSVNLNGYEEGTWTKEDVEITASATDALSGIKESTYVDQTITEEGETEVVMDATDVAGNATSDTVLIKIDKTAPVASVDLNGYEEGTWTKEDVQITASAEDALSGIATSTYVDQTITEEGQNTVAMEATDLAGNVKNDSVQVWIDKTAPVFQNVDTHGYEEGTWTSDPVTITATAFDALSGIAGQADFEVTLTESGIIEWTAVDKAGNEQKFFFEVLIDNGSPVITLDAGGYEFGTWTNKDAILVDMNVTSASPIVERTPAAEDLPVVVTEEGKTSLEFYAKNEVGNTATENVQVWIDRTAPVVTASYAPVEDLTPYVVVTADFQEDTLSGLKSKEYSFDGATWSDYSGNFKVYQNTAVYFRATDNAGNVGTANITISNVAIDYAEVEGNGSAKDVPLATEYGVSGKYVVNGDFGEITGKLTVKNNGKAVFTATLEYGEITKTSNKDGSTAFMLDNSKLTVVEMSVNEKKTAGSTEWDIQFVTDDDRFIEGDNGDDTVATAYDLGVLDYEGEVFENWVGFGDEIDYRVFTLESSAKLTFGFEAEDTAKMTVYQLNTKTGKLKSLGNVAISAKEVETTKYTKELLVEAGTYYIAVQSTNKKAASGTGAGEYEVSVAGEFYPAAADLNLNNQTWKTASIMDEDPSTRWVGFGDAADFYKFSVDENGKIAFDMDEDTYKAVLAKELKITCLTDTGKSVALEQLDKDTLVSKKEMAAGDYILGVTCANTKKFNTYYDITVAVL